MQYDALHQCIYAQDLGKRTTFKISTSDLAKKEPVVEPFIQFKEDSKEGFILNDWWVYLKNDCILGANSTIDGMLVSFDKNKNNVKYYEPYPNKNEINENLTDIANMMLYQSYGAVSPQMDKVAIDYHGADILGFAQVSKESLKVKYNKRAFPNDIYIIQSGPETVQGAFTGESMTYYTAIAAAKDYAYFLWKGKKKKDCEKGFTRSSCVKVYDWEGNPVSELHLDKDVYQIAVSPDEKYLFALSSSSESGYSLLKYMTLAKLQVVLLIFVVLVSCKGKREQEIKMEQWQDYSRSFIESHLNKQIILPDSAFNLAFSIAEVDSVMNQPLKILVNVDIECKACLRKFYFWSEFSSRINKEEKLRIPIIMYINFGQPKVVKELVEKYWKGFWLCDSKYEFLDKNDLHDDRFQAVLIDKDNRIKLIGNPIYNERLSELYQSTIISLLKEYETKKSI